MHAAAIQKAVSLFRSFKVLYSLPGRILLMRSTLKF